MKAKYSYCSEEILWTAFKNGDEQAYEFMFKTYYKLLLRYGLKINRNVEEIKDCIQQLFAGLWESRQRLGTNTSVKSYLYASLRRIILRRIKAKVHYVNIEDINPKFHLFEVSPELNYVRDQKEMEQTKLLDGLMKKLPARQKEAIYLKYFADHAFGEIAEIMGINTRGVYKLIYKALDGLTLEVQKKNLTAVV